MGTVLIIITRRSLLFFIILCVVSSIYSADNTDNSCLDCHDGYDKLLEFTPHRLQSGAKIEISCIDCHSGAKNHIEDPSADNISNPKNLSAFEAINTCNKCHTSHSSIDNFGYDSHNTAELGCFSCHQVHSNKPSLLLDNNGAFCLNCHSDVKSQFEMVSNHPVGQSEVSCISCHNFSKKTDDNFSYELFSVCADCHPSESSPHLFEHDAVNSFSVEGGGCIDCHNPHGSENDRLLKQPKKNLCNSCHIVPRHETAHTGLYRNLDCNYCHTETHGSFDNRYFLDPDLISKLGRNCYESGCHSSGR